MGTPPASCPHCSSGGFWASFTDAIRSVFGLKRKGDRLERIPIPRIRENPYQPRSFVLAEPHEKLKDSIRQYGVIVPIIVSRLGDQYVLVAGQRRLLAARELGLTHIPAIVRTLDPRQRMEASYLENLHREDLSRLDVVEMFDRIRKRYPDVPENELCATMGLKAEDLEKARTFELLPDGVKAALRARMISEEHAPVLAQIRDADILMEVIELVYNERLSPEDTGEMVDRILRKEPSFVTSDGSHHFHAPHCPYAQLIPEPQRQAFHSKKEGVRRGKIACMQCL